MCACVRVCVCVRHSSKGVLQWDKQNRTEGTPMNEGGRVCVRVQKVCYKRTNSVNSSKGVVCVSIEDNNNKQFLITPAED